MSNKYDVVILGGVIVGLSIAKQILEKNVAINSNCGQREYLGKHNSGRNNEFACWNIL